jgi:ADP-heptose:LPS heptosyltransferase
MNILIVKLNATGDVVRTSSLLHRLHGQITWVTAKNNVALFEGIENVRCICWGSDQLATLHGEAFDLVLNLEDELDTARFVQRVKSLQLFGAYVDDTGQMRYTDSAKGWFDLSIISSHGRKRADELKYQNRRSYQDLVFEGLGFEFAGERYVLPKAPDTGLRGDVAIAPVAGPVWPMKNWAYYDQLKIHLEELGYTVNVLPRRDTLLQHIGDICGHRCLVGGDSLPMHLALGVGVPCVTIFNCTSPWEIHDYGLQTQLISPLLGEYFYKRTFDARATTAIPLQTVLDSVLKKLSSPMPIPSLTI